MNELNNIFGGVEQLWEYIKLYAEKAGREATRIVLELYYVVKSPQTPTLDKTIIIAALAYQLLPQDLISRDKYGWLGFVDNGAALALAYSKVKTRVTPQIETQVEAVLNQWFVADCPQTQVSYDNQYIHDDSQNNESWDSQQSTIPSNYSTSFVPNIPNATICMEDEDVIID